MPDGASGDPFRIVSLVVAALAVALLGVLLAVQAGETSAVGVLTIPLVVVVPLAAAGLYWFVRKRR